MKLDGLASAAVVALTFAAAPAAQASFQVISGDTTSAPTYNRALEDFSGLSGIGTDVRYDTYTFTVSVAGDYLFNTTGAFDTFVFLYQGSFNPADATTNGVFANDDLFLGNSFAISGFEVPLAPGTTYIYVTTGFDVPDAGAYSTTIAGPAPLLAVPEPETYAMMGLGLLGLGTSSLRRRRR